MTSIAQSRVMDLTVACQSFPVLPEPQIRREHLLDTIDGIFAGGADVVVLEGPEGIGKTTLQAQFAGRHPHHAFSLFISPTSRWAYDPETLRRDLGNQFQWALRREPLPERTIVDDSFLRRGLNTLQGRARRDGAYYYFLVDGLEDLPGDSQAVLDLVLRDLLPVGLPGFRCLITGDLGRLTPYFHRRVRAKSYTLSAFSYDETSRYFVDLTDDPEALAEVHRLCGGIPLRLATMRRILHAGGELRALLDAAPHELPELFEFEWRETERAIDAELLLLAIMAHDHKSHRLEDLAGLVRLPVSEARAFLERLSFVALDSESGEVGFASEPFRAFAADRLREREREVHDRLIEDLLGHPDSDAALFNLPGYLERAGRFSDLLTYLSPEHLSAMLEHSHSLAPIRRTALHGIDAALRLGRDSELLRFGVQRSALIELDGAGMRRSEIKARMALGEEAAALMLAQATVLREDRLHLLAVIGRQQRERGLAPDPDLLAQIRQLYEQIDRPALGQRGTAIAADLLYTLPDLAITLVEEAAATEAGENALDLAFATLSVAAGRAGVDRAQPVDTVEAIRARIKDPRVRDFSIATGLLLGEFTAAEVIAEAEKLDKAGNRLYLLRQWAVENRQRDDAAEVVAHALKLAIATTAYAPNARDLRELAMPLPFVADEATARTLVATFDGQRGAVERLGPTEEYVRLLLLLAQAEQAYDLEAARKRLVDVYLLISELDDLLTRANCLAWLVATLAEMDPRRELEATEGLHTLAEAELAEDLARLLDGSAEHYEAVQGIIRALAPTVPQEARDLALRLNIEPRRELALLELVDAATQVPTDQLDPAFLHDVIARFVGADMRDEAVLNVLERLATVAEPRENLVAVALPLLDRIGNIARADERCRACCLAVAFLHSRSAERHAGLIAHLLRQLDTALEQIDVGWLKVDVGFRVAASLSSREPDAAREYLRRADEYRAEMLLDSTTVAESYLTGLFLVARAYAGLLPRGVARDEDLVRFAALIDRVPSRGERANVWSEVALRCHLAGRADACRRVVDEHVRPLLRNLPEGNPAYRVRVLVAVAPALYLAHKSTAFEQLAELPVAERDEAYRRIAQMILRKRSPNDPHSDAPGRAYDVDYNDVVDLCEIMEQVNHDQLLDVLTEMIVDSMTDRRRQRLFSQQQREDIAGRLERVAAAKLPDQRHIQHQGYVVTLRVQLARLRQERAPEVWASLLAAARAIPNEADRAYVLAIVVGAMPAREAARRSAAFAEAKTIVENLPIDLDRIERLDALSETIMEADPSAARACLVTAMRIAVASDRSELQPVQRRIIDRAHQLDPDLAASLASLADDDPAREEARANLQHRLGFCD